MLHSFLKKRCRVSCSKKGIKNTDLEQLVFRPASELPVLLARCIPITSTAIKQEKQREMLFQSRIVKTNTSIALSALRVLNPTLPHGAFVAGIFVQ